MFADGVFHVKQVLVAMLSIVEFRRRWRV